MQLSPTPTLPPVQGEELLKFKLIASYDGTAYQGWQVQKTGIGVQQKIEESLSKLFPSRPRVHGSSRTDTGVHALGMVAHFEIPATELRMTVQKLALAINANLPPDVRIRSATAVPSTFHARFDATGKQYRYFIWHHAAMNPLLRFQAWHVPPPLDFASMRVAARAFLGRHDFKSFAANRNYEMESTVRTLTRCELKRNGPLLTVVIEGDGFLYKMCRGIVGTLVQVGQGKISSTEIHRILAQRDRRVAGMSAPAPGLVLWKVFYRKSRQRESSKRRTTSSIPQPESGIRNPTPVAPPHAHRSA